MPKVTSLPSGFDKFIFSHSYSEGMRELVFPTSAGSYTFGSLSSNTYVLPVNTQYIELLLVGGGGGGGGTDGGNTTRGGGGGAGGVIHQMVNISGFTSLTATIGAGGAAGVASSIAGSKGSNGGNSTITGTGFSTITAGGGGGGGMGSSTAANRTPQTGATGSFGAFGADATSTGAGGGGGAGCPGGWNLISTARPTSGEAASGILTYATILSNSSGVGTNGLGHIGGPGAGSNGFSAPGLGVIVMGRQIAGGGIGGIRASSAVTNVQSHYGGAGRTNSVNGSGTNGTGGGGGGGYESTGGGGGGTGLCIIRYWG